MKDKDMQLIIGWVLRAGVIISVCIVSLGGMLFIYRHGNSISNYHTFKGIPAFVSNFSGIINGILTWRGQAIIQAGIILLIATPVVRVIFSAISFVLEKDWLYTAITLIVLLIIFISMLGGHAG